MVVIKRLRKEDIKVTVHLPENMDEIRKIWTATYCNYAAGLINSSGLPVQMKHQVVDELLKRFSSLK